MNNETIQYIQLGDGGGDEFLVHLRVVEQSGFFEGFDPRTAEATVYAAQSWDKSDGSSSGVGYVLRQDGSHTGAPVEGSRVMCVIRCEWRGCWDERSYTKDDEYWSGELAMMGKIEAMVLPFLREMVMGVNKIAASGGKKEGV